ncbi:MAG: hypothetical protein R2780_14010 [Crocinitomicaceae bacterium]|nr:hypothetical protein [Crocinitomicaceae bacterium]
MKRRKFLVYSMLLGLAIIAKPSDLLANDNVVIPLPEAENHVRHGDFNLDQLSGVQLPNGVSNVRFQRFYKNGFIEGPDDLCVVTFLYENETHIVQFKFYELCEKGYIDCASKNSSKKVFTLF